jgi:hypothetical protein
MALPPVLDKDKRVMKHAGEVYFFGGPNMPPAERVCVGKV